MKYIIILFVVMASCSIPDLDFEVGPTAMPRVNFCYATGRDFFYATNYPPTEMRLVLADVGEDRFIGVFSPGDEIEVFPFAVDGFGIIDVYLYRYRQPYSATGECLITVARNLITGV